MNRGKYIYRLSTYLCNEIIIILPNLSLPRTRYHPPAPGYAYAAPPPPGALYYPPGAPIDPHLASAWERYPPGVLPPPGGYSDWRPKDRGDYRRDYDRRPATSNS